MSMSSLLSLVLIEVLGLKKAPVGGVLLGVLVDESGQPTMTFGSLLLMIRILV